MDYVTLEAYKARYGITTFDRDDRLAEHITAASRKVDTFCRRNFAEHTGVATARYFRPTSPYLVFLDDAYDIILVDVDDDADGTYATAWPATDYETDPPNGVGPDGAAGWPATVLRAIGETEVFPCSNLRRPVRVTAKWGWPAVPDAVAEATYLFAARLAYEVSVPGGVLPPSPDFGIPGVALARPYTAEGLLRPYVKPGQMVA